jgi:hypothetical protein
MGRGKRLLGVGAVGLLLPFVSEMRVKRATRPLTDDWRQLPVESRGATGLGISFRPPQAEALGLDTRKTLDRLLPYPFELIRLGAYWNRMEPEPHSFRTDELDWQIDAAEQAGKKIILCAGGVKTFSYPEYFVPDHVLTEPLPEGTVIRPGNHGRLLDAATAFITRVVERYRDRQSIVAWQVEHEAVEPLGLEHSWRLSVEFLRAEIEAVRTADSSRPVMLNGFLPTSLPVRLQQWWRTRDQGDSLAVAQELADVIGIDFYPRHALLSLGQQTLYLDGSQAPWQQGPRKRLFAWADAEPGRQVMISEGQAEPWETVTDPPNPRDGVMYSCPPEQVISNYNQCMRWNQTVSSDASGYLFWGAEYWVLRHQDGDPSYLQAFARVLEES